MRKGLLPVLVTVIFVGLIVVLAVRELNNNSTVVDENDPISNADRSGMFTLIASFEVTMPEPRGIALGPDGNLLICGAGGVEILSPDGISMSEYSIDETAECAASGESGIIYLGTDDHVSTIDSANGSTREWATLDERSIITSIAVSGDRVFVADAGTRRVWIFDLSGMLLKMIDGFLVPSPYFDVVKGPDGGVWIVDPGRHSVALYDTEGEKSFSFGRYSMTAGGFTGCCNPTNIAVRSDGSVVTAEKGFMYVKLFGEGGDFLGLVAGGRDFPIYDSEIDLAGGMDGEIYVLSPRARRILVFEGGDGNA